MTRTGFTFQERDLRGEDLVAVFVDGKTCADSTLVIAMGVRITGEKRFLGFAETDTENEAVLTPFLRSLWERGLTIARGLLVVVDGGKGLRAAVRKAFVAHAPVQRCQWRKRENVVRYLPKREQAGWRRRLHRAHERLTCAEARAALQALAAELEQNNQSAAASLADGLEETPTLHRLGVYGVLGRSLQQAAEKPRRRETSARQARRAPEERAATACPQRYVEQRSDEAARLVQRSFAGVGGVFQQPASVLSLK